MKKRILEWVWCGFGLFLISLIISAYFVYNNPNDNLSLGIDNATLTSLRHLKDFSERFCVMNGMQNNGIIFGIDVTCVDKQGEIHIYKKDYTFDDKIIIGNQTFKAEWVEK